ncbi:hypothetical protein Ddye_011064 [Dipteronia dyeriana]|uniref:SWIM-type domain-containing protein n=1 Tax=Dipteronia dyeriana TaxID=168575 RepID=A0AAD9XEV3_9ROSI|nr:hypothetical protein Ddye_011064 [Dipteronia dyeriana]
MKSDHVTNNISECFNVWMGKFRAQPALTILEGVRRKMIQRMAKRLEEGRNWVSNIPDLVNKKLSKRQDDSRFVLVLCASDKEFEVKDGVTFYMVNLDSKRCDYGLWELFGIPCKHALAVLTGTRQQAKIFIHSYLLKVAYIRTYNNIIHPIPDQSLWPNIQANPVLPPEKKRKSGRPNKSRKRAPDEPRKMKRSGRVKCSSCGACGHNKRTCTGSVTGQAEANNKGTNTHFVYV